MNFDAARMYELLPAIYRIRDAERDESLKALLSVIADQVGILEEDLAQLYDDQFIETCTPWVVPYIGDLIGYRALHNVVPTIGSERAEVAHTIGYRRRKGTAAMLEQLARDVTGWNARVVEFFQLLGWTQWTPNHIRPTSFYAPDLRNWETLEKINGPFDTVAHTVEVRQVATGQGKYNIQNIGIFLWRLGAYSLTKSPAFKIDANHFLFHPLGCDTSLFTNPKTEDEITHLAEPINVPAPISRRVLDAYLSQYYGDGASVSIDGVPIEQVIVCDLSDWVRTPPAVKVAIDPVLGRIAFADAPKETPLVTFHYGFSDEMGGGEYDRAATFDALLTPVEKVPAPHTTIQDALDVVTGGGVVEVSNSGRYNETLEIKVDAKHVELRGVNEHRPTLIAAKPTPPAPPIAIDITGGAGAQLTLNGLLIAGGPIRILSALGETLRKVRLLHCTLVPGLSLGIDGTPDSPGAASLLVEHTETPIEIEIDHCIVGAIHAPSNATVLIRDSIVDANSSTAMAYSDLDGIGAGGTVSVVNSTIIGTVHTLELKLASNSIFMSDVTSEKKQSGCVRFCYLPLTSVVPRRYRCQPEEEGDALRVTPQFTSLAYSDAGYGQLTPRTAEEIRTGADDEAELGAFHEIYAPQRETNLRIRLEEYLRFGLEAGIFYVT